MNAKYDSILAEAMDAVRAMQLRAEAFRLEDAVPGGTDLNEFDQTPDVLPPVAPCSLTPDGS